MIVKLPFLKRSIFLYTLIAILCTTGIESFSQTVVSSTGEQLGNTNYQLSFTMGETSIRTLEAGDVILSQGFHQTKLTVTAIKDILNNNFNVSVFPNPTSDYLSISTDVKDLNQCFYVIYNLNGEMLKQDSFKDAETQIPFKEFPSSIYILKVFINNQEFNSYKIVKQ